MKQGGSFFFQIKKKSYIIKEKDRNLKITYVKEDIPINSIQNQRITRRLL